MLERFIFLVEINNFVEPMAKPVFFEAQGWLRWLRWGVVRRRWGVIRRRWGCVVRRYRFCPIHLPKVSADFVFGNFPKTKKTNENESAGLLCQEKTYENEGAGEYLSIAVLPPVVRQ